MKPSVTLVPPMRRGRRLLLASLLLAVSQNGAHAEIHRLSLEEAASEIVATQGTPSPGTRFSIPLDDLVSQVPDMARVVLPDDEKPDVPNIRAIFAVKQPGSEAKNSLAVRMHLIDDRTYGVARWSRRAFRTWLRKRVSDLLQGSVVLENIVGVEAAGVSFYLSVADVAAELIVEESTKSDPRSALQQILGTSILGAGFTDIEGGARRFAEFEERTLLLNIWATWCAPCIAEMPALEKLQDRYRDRGLTVVNLSDESADVIQDWLSDNGSSMLHGRVDGFEFLLGDPPAEGVNRSLGVRPVYVIVDREGIVREVRVGVVKRLGGDTTNVAPGGESEHHAAAWVEPYL